MSLESLSSEILPVLEEELWRAIQPADGPGLAALHTMLAYHMGWEGEGAGPEATGKRIRPLTVLLTTSAAGGKWRCALPAAAAIELIHNFSLIHDDIEDRSPLRHRRPTLWKKWGIAQAVNTGDTLFTLAHLSILRLGETIPPAAALSAAHILQETSLHLTQGQYLDIAYEAQQSLDLEAYWPMVTGKTAALLAACTEIGALIARAPEVEREHYREFGGKLGLAFQVQDDLLGIWGDAALTGKSAESDLLTGKKSLPVLYGLSQQGSFARRWAQGPIPANEVADLSRQLEAEGARQYTQDYAVRLTSQALDALDQAHPHGEAGEALRELANKLVGRKA